jgi:hypothetical protein
MATDVTSPSRSNPVDVAGLKLGAETFCLCAHQAGEAGPHTGTPLLHQAAGGHNQPLFITIPLSGNLTSRARGRRPYRPSRLDRAIVESTRQIRFLFGVSPG